MALPTPINPYFLIKIDKKKQMAKGQKIGRFWLPVVEGMHNNVQCGEIVSISEKAHENFPEAQIGHLLLIHHMVESMDINDAREDHWVDEDEDYNYYVVTPIHHNGKRNEVYGVWDGEKIIMHPYFLLLEADKPINGATAVDDFINQAVKESTGGLLVFKEWRESREEKTERIKRIKEEVQNLGDKNKLTPQLKAELSRKEEEMAKISLEINTDAYAPYKLVASNPLLSEWFNKRLGPGDTIYCQAKATQTMIDFMGIEYRTCPVSFVGFILS